MTDTERIDELERRVKELESQPKEQHTHFHTYPPVYQQPYVPLPWNPWTVTYGGGGNAVGTAPLIPNW